MKIRIVDTDSEFDALEGPWNQLSEQASPNFFSSFDYVRMAWKHLRGSGDRLYILVLSEGSSIIGIAPFYIERRQKWRIPFRAIRWIGTLEGDRPRLIVRENEEMCWNEISRFLKSQEHCWDIFDLVEQPVEGPEGRGWLFLPCSGWYWRKLPDLTNYYISLQGSWEDYLKDLDANIRHQWNRRKRRLCSNYDGYQVERISDPERIREALSRFVVVEQAGWKGKEGVGVGKNKQTLLFYEELLVRLAGKEKAVIYFLKSSGETIAGKICFIQQDIVYSRQTTYLPSFANYSPGILLGAEIIEDLFRGPYRELDLLGSSRLEAPPKHKIDWATGRRETVHFTACRVYSRLLPYVVFKHFEQILKRGWWRNQEQNEGSILRLRKSIRKSFPVHFFR